MDLFKANIFKAGILKQAKFLISAPTKAQNCIYISDTGVVSLEILPTDTGFINADNVKKAWLALSPLKFKVLKDGVPYQDESVYVICDRTYFPVDPHKRLKPSERDKLTKLNSIAKIRHAQARMDMGREPDPHASLMQSIITGGFIILAFIGFAAIIMHSCGG